MKLLKWLYEKKNKKPAPYYYNYSLLTILAKPIRKWLANAVAPNCPFNCIRILIYKICGFKIGKHVFIGMRCYLDDMCYDQMKIGNNVTISYGVYFACHGKWQKHHDIVIEDGAYIGMRASVITPSGDVVIGKGAVVGAAALVNQSVPADKLAVGVPIRIMDKKEDVVSE